MYDIIIIGGGPAGLTAAIYARRADKSVLVIDKATFGGQITFSPRVENIPGFVSLSGNEYAEKLVDQVMTAGADIELCEVTGIKNGIIKTVITDDGEFQCKTVIIATGAKHRLLGIHGEERFIGDGISFCAVCDGAFYKDKTVAVIGGGNSALQEALLLSEQCKQVKIIQNLDFLTGENKLIEQINLRENITVTLGAVVDSFIGETELTGINIKNKSGNISEIPVDGVFVAIGLVPQNDFASDLIELDERGYVISDENALTNAEGIFVAGDCRTKKIRQVATACSDGAVAALAACEYIDNKV